MKNTDLLTEILNKNETAFELFLDGNIRLFYNTIYRVIAPVATHEDIMDCLLESISYIWFHIYLYDSTRYPFRTWCSLIIICRVQNKYISIQRYNKKLERVLSFKHTQLSFAPSAESIYLEDQAYKNILRCSFHTFHFHRITLIFPFLYRLHLYQ